MTKINDIFKNGVLQYAQREFNVQETFKLLIMSNPSKYMSWGVSQKFGIYNKALLLYVDANHHKGWVLITLAWNDTYSFYIFEDIREIKHQQHEVYFDQLQELIDLKIEYINGYEF